MRYIIIGAGAVGGVIGGRLAGAGHEVVLVARGAQHAALRADGLRLQVPDGEYTYRLPAVEKPDELGELRADDVLVLAVKTQDTASALQTWSVAPVAGGGTAAERLPLFCAQNGVEGQRLALRVFRQVYGVCVWLPATFLEPGVVSAGGAPLSGILHLGRYPHGTDETARLVAADLEKTRFFEAPVVPDVLRWQYAKLLTNLTNTVQALAGEDEGQESRVSLRARVRAEGEAVLDAAGIPYASVEEQQALRGHKVDLVPLEGAPRGGGSTWQSLSRGTGAVEADYLNGEIALLGRLHGLPTPLSDLLQQLANTFARERRAAGSMPIEELVRRADEAVAFVQES
ncbi:MULTISPECIES: ketopantoate reductase family protein [unclassified Streptomyces]|uniref:ketopantoate reductase family protein n=1 Tax=unclassified Streptomyces TaxID=2593676 RepID=UPI002253CA50|nr:MULTISPECIES: 2-dehydropantoate 2-reductase N-terminal domain-containing protein [unclassified Streptomyces]MCX4884407.1 NAD(P)-binding domain-containing protein [Streptomyces sp. NBC_00847]MCX5424526.1 NAD(P)-binding domain-containing protein [Streptomyces sp. NBC_00078]